MKKIFGCTALFTLMLALANGVFAQDGPQARALTVDDYKAIKNLKVKNLEKDTYVKFDEGYILDRYEMKKPFVFSYSDKIERKVYLFRLLESDNMVELGILAIYTTPHNGKTINICIPGPAAGRETWGFHIDELKYRGEEEPALLSALGFVLSKEFSALCYANTAEAAASSDDDDEYEYCFPAPTLVTMADGSEKSISSIVPGDEVAAIGPDGEKTATTVTSVQAHGGKEFSLARLALLPLEGEAVASTAGAFTGLLFVEATPSHPLLTQQGAKPLGHCLPGDVLYCLDAATQTFKRFAVSAAAVPAGKTGRVYNLHTKAGNFVAGGIAVADKRK